MKTFASFAGAFWKGWSQHNILQRASALAYAALFSMAPILLVLTAVAATFLGADSARNEVFARIADVAGSGAAKQALQLVDATNRHSGWPAIAIGFVLALAGGIAIVLQFEAALDAIWDAPTRTGSGIWAAVRQRLIAGLALVVIITGFLVLAAADAALSRMHMLTGGTAHALAILGALACVFAFFAAVYRTMPQRRPDWRHVAMASLVTTVLVAIGQIGFAIYLHFVNFASAYGQAGSVVVLLVWLYYSCAAALTGAELARTIAVRAGGPLGTV
jgi:membrane protein